MPNIEIETKTWRKRGRKSTGKKATVTNLETSEVEKFIASSMKNLRREIKKKFNIRPDVKLPERGSIITSTI